MNKTCLFIFALALSSLCVDAQQSIVESEGIYYKLENSQATVSARPDGRPYDMATFAPKSTISTEGVNYAVRELANDALKGSKEVKTLILPDNLFLYKQDLSDSGIEKIVYNSEISEVYQNTYDDLAYLKELVFNSTLVKFEWFEAFNPGVSEISFSGGDYLVMMYAQDNGAAYDEDVAHLSANYRTTVTSNVNRINWDKNTEIILTYLPWFRGETLSLTGKTILGLTGEMPVIRLSFYYNEFDFHTVKRLELAEVQALSWDAPYRIGRDALKTATSLTEIVSYGTTPWDIAPDAFASDEAMKAITLYVPRAAVDTYKAHPVWGKMGAIVAIETVTPMVVEGRTWWYKAKEWNTDLEYGIRIGSKVEIDGTTWNKVYMCLNHKNVWMNSYVDPTYTWMELDDEDGLAAYIREADGQVYVKFITPPYNKGLKKYPGQTIYGLTLWSSFVPDGIATPTADILMYDFNRDKEVITLGADGDNPDYTHFNFRLVNTGEIESHGYTYRTYRYKSEPGFFSIPDYCTFVEGIGILCNDEEYNSTSLFYSLFPYLITSINPCPELRYVTEGEDNHIIFEHIGGTKLWAEYDGVADIKVEAPDAAPDYYDMQGRRVENPAAGQLVIKRQGDRVTKLVVK